MTGSPAPEPSEIFDRAIEEGERRLDQSLLELVSTGFIAGFMIVFGIVALGIVEALLAPYDAGVVKLAGALAFGVGVVFLVVGRVELFSENFFDPTAAVVARSDWTLASLARLWLVTLLVNLAGGGVFAVVFAVEGVLPSGAAAALRTFAVESTERVVLTWFASAVAGGALVTLLSFLLVGVNRVDRQRVNASVERLRQTDRVFERQLGVVAAVGRDEDVVVLRFRRAVG